MLNVPGYVQRKERCNNLQEKALKFGVLGWKNLGKWTDNHRRETVNDKAAVFLSSGNDPSPCSTSGSSSQSRRNGDSRRVACRNQSPPLKLRQDSSAKDDNTVLSEEETSGNGMGYPSSETIRSKCLVSCPISDSAEQRLRMDNLSAKLENNKREALDSKSVSDNVGHYSCAGTLSSRSKDCAASHSINGKLKTLKSVPDYREKSGELSHECCSTSLSTVVDCPQKHHSERSQPSDDILDPFQENSERSRCFSFASTESGYTIQSESGDTSFVEILPYENFQLTTPNISHSRSLTPNGHACEWSDVNVGFHEHGEGSEVPCHLTNSPPQSGKLETVRSNGWHENIDNPAIKPHNSFAGGTPEKLSWTWVKRVTASGRESLHNNDSCGELSDVIGSSRSRENSARKQLKWSSSSDGRNGERASDSWRGRRSPLRRLIDPLLKPKAFNQTHAAKLDAGSPTKPSCESKKLSMQEESSFTSGLYSSTPEITHSYRSNSARSFTFSRWAPMGNQCSDHIRKHEASNQTLLQLAWKNGLPLFTFSVNESDILAATRKKVMTGKEDSDCVYTLYYVSETKKKTGSWINQGSKSKRKGLLSSVVGQMNVSCIRYHKNHVSVMEFVLLGPELRPSAHGTLEPVPNSELAAIVVKVPETDVESFIGDLPQGNICGDLLKTNLQEDKHAFQSMGVLESEQNTEKNAPKMVAILPNEVHGLSDTGKPSPLVDRWKSQGLCDCGGWDVGCSLKILTDNLQHGRPGSVQPSHTADGTNRVELFIQGLGQESRPVFSLVAFKEGLYTVDFHASIAPLQAFVVCIAILHSGKSTRLHEPQSLHQPRRWFSTH